MPYKTGAMANGIASASLALRWGKQIYSSFMEQQEVSCNLINAHTFSEFAAPKPMRQLIHSPSKQALSSALTIIFGQRRRCGRIWHSCPLTENMFFESAA